MDRQQLCIRIRDTGQEARAAIRGLIRVPAEHGGPGRPVDLQRVMHQIAGDHGMLTAAIDVYAAMARRVARGGFDGDAIIQAEIIIHQQRLPRRHHGFAIHGEDRTTATGAGFAGLG